MEKFKIKSFKDIHTCLLALRTIIINILILISLLIALEFIFATIQTNKEISDNLKTQNQNNIINFPKFTLCEYFAEIKNRFICYYKETDYNKYFSLDEFRKPTTGKQYKNACIVIAGCSFTYGEALDDDETFGAVLSEKYPKYKIYNIGLTGASSRETLYILRNHKKYEKENLLPKQGEETKFVIYTYIHDQKRRLINNVFRISPNFKIVKNEKGEKELSFYKSNNPIIKTFIYKYYARKYQPINDKYLQNLFTLYMQEIKKETEKIFPNAKFVLFVYSDDLNDLDIKTIEQQGITVIELKNIINKDIYSDEKYKAWDKGHPNRLAWEEITPVLGEILQF